MGFGQGGVERVKSVKMNRAQLNNRKGKGYFNSPQNSETVFDKFVDHTQMSPDELAAFKAKVKQREADNQKRLAITFGITVVILVSAFFYFLLYI